MSLLVFIPVDLCECRGTWKEHNYLNKLERQKDFFFPPRSWHLLCEHEWTVWSAALSSQGVGVQGVRLPGWTLWADFWKFLCISKRQKKSSEERQVSGKTREGCHVLHTWALRKGGRVGVGGGGGGGRGGWWEGISSTTRSLPPIHLEDISAPIHCWLTQTCWLLCVHMFVCVPVLGLGWGWGCCMLLQF